MEESRSTVKEFWKSLSEKLKESLVSVMPVSVIVLILALTPWVEISGSELITFLIAALLLVLGIGMFNLGADMAMTPMGQYMGQGLTSSKRLGVLLSVGFIMGVLITVAEPDLSVLADQVKTVMSGTMLIFTVGFGVGLLLFLGILKILFHIDLSVLLMYLYMALFCVAALLPVAASGEIAASVPYQVAFGFSAVMALLSMGYIVFKVK